MFEQAHLPNWRRLTLWPAVLLLLTLLLIAALDLDQRFADALFALNRAFPFQHSTSYEFWLHKLPKKIAAAGFFLLLITALLPRRRRHWRQWQLPLWLAIVAILMASASIGALKELSDAYCPAQIDRYGGSVHELLSGPWPVFAAPGTAALGNCWPAGHASTGLVFVALYFSALMMAKPRLARWLLWGSLLVGQALGLSQVVRGQHFLSHQIWSTAICWFCSVSLFWFWHTVAERRRSPQRTALLQ